MNTGLKIRWLILLLGVICFITSLTLRQTISPEYLLRNEAGKLQRELNQKEKATQKLIKDDAAQAKLLSLIGNEAGTQAFINEYRNQGINLLIYDKEQLKYWTSYRIFPPDIRKIKEGTSFISMANGYYELVKKTHANYTFVFLITVKTNYAIENQYLKNEIWSNLFDKNTLDIARFSDKNVVEIFSLNKSYLFSAKLSPNYNDNIFSLMQLCLWIAAFIFVSIFVNAVCNTIVHRGHPLRASMLLASYFAFIRYIDLKFFWFNHQLDLNIFNPAIYAESDLLPSLGDLLLNVIAFTWVIVFIYVNRKHIRLPRWICTQKTSSTVILLLFIALMGLTAIAADNLFFGLVFNSKIDFNISNIVQVNWMSWLSLFILSLVWLCVFLLASTLIYLTAQLATPRKNQLLIFLLTMLAYTAYKTFDDFNIYYLIFGVLLFVIYYQQQILERYTSWTLALIFLCTAGLSTIRYIKFEDIKERNQRAIITKHLLFEDDPKVINALAALEKSLSADSQLVSYFKQPLLNQTYGFHNYLSKKYLDGFLSRFDAKFFEYNPENQSLKLAESLPINRYKDLTSSGAMKLPQSKYFYRVNDTFGYQNYFGIVPILVNSQLLGSLVIELKSKPIDYNSNFPEFLIDGKFKNNESLQKYSIAFYKNNQLLNRSGSYNYNLRNPFPKPAENDIELVNNEGIGSGYNHIIYQASADKTIVVSAKKLGFDVRFATLSFFFLVLLAFGLLCYIMVWIIVNLNDRRTGFLRLNRILNINATRILYKTRIQFSIVLSVVATLVIVGWATFFNIKLEHQEQQNDLMREKLRTVQANYEKSIALNGISQSPEAQAEFNQFADMNGVYLNLFDRNGHLFLTSLPILYDTEIIGRNMPPTAYLDLAHKKTSEFINPNEAIGTFNYAAAYAPIKNANQQTVAYIGIPFFANNADYERKIGPFVNTLINIYALVFVLIGVLAVFLAKQITEPLSFIQENIKRTKLGQINKPIKWRRQDEIGVLVREYNKMIAELEISANKIARSERESTWREIAKQVAHEIKNPLTPLKLGVQLLERSWREKDPDFEQKFERFNKSFIEQIDSLANIASEFSKFAKMPETKLEKFAILPLIKQSKSLYDGVENVQLQVIDKSTKFCIILADHDQLLRAFGNLFKNAAEAANETKMCQIQVSIRNDDSQIFVEVHDNGIGIPAELQEKIFSPNFTTKTSGTGLGLAFVKQAVENADGHIQFSSSPKQGTSFYLTFPLASYD